MYEVFRFPQYSIRSGSLGREAKMKEWLSRESLSRLRTIGYGFQLLSSFSSMELNQKLTLKLGLRLRT